MKKRIASVITLIAFWVTSVFPMPISAADTAPQDEVELIPYNMLDVNVVDENGTTITGISMSLVDENGVEVATWTNGERKVNMANSSYISGVSNLGAYEVYMAKLLEAAKSLIGDKEIFFLKRGTTELWSQGNSVHNSIYCRPDEKTEYTVQYFENYATDLTVEGGKVVTVVDARSDDSRISIFDAAGLSSVKNFKIADIKGTNTFELTPGEYNVEGLDMSVSDQAVEYVKLRIKLSDVFGSKYFNEQGAFKHDSLGEVSFPSTTAGVTGVLTFCSGSVITVACPDSEGFVEVYVEKNERRLGIDVSFSSNIGAGGKYFPLEQTKTVYNEKSFIGKGVALPTTGTLLYYVPAGNYTVKMLRTPSGYQPKDPVTVSVVDSNEVQKLSIALDAVHTHAYGTEYKTDADNHWKECACGEKTEIAEHTYTWVIDKEATGTQEGSKREVCSVCGYEKQTVTIPVVEAPETGDCSNVPLLFALAAAALALFAGAAVYGKKRIYNQD